MGWIVAGIIVVLVGGLIGYVLLFPATSDPTEDTKAPGAMDYQDIAVPITTVIPAEPSGSGNAAEDYQKAVNIVAPLFEKAIEGNPEFPRTILNDAAADIGTWLKPEKGEPQNKPVNPEGLQLMEKIAAYVAQGATKKEMKYFGPDKLDKMEVTYSIPDAKYFELVSQALSDYAHYHNLVLKKPEEAQKIIFNRFIMGWHMAHDRVYPRFVCTGFEIQARCCTWLADLYLVWPGHEGQGEKLQTYKTAAMDVVSFFNNKNKYMFSKFVKEQEADWPNPGDLFNVVQNDKDPCWRVQGIFSLGMLKWHPALDKSKGDPRMRRNLIEEKLKNGTDEEKAAARAADKYTKEDNANLGTKNANY
jgi:hypothetical protein